MKKKVPEDIIGRYKRRMRKFLSFDPKTGIYNFRYFEHHFNEKFNEAQEKGLSISLIIIDIDYFKSVNDTYGFVMGDHVLRQLADLLKNELRPADLICRFGGEEFVVIMPATNFPRARNIAENIIDKVSDATFGDKRTKIKLTVSIGFYSYPDGSVKTSTQFINMAEKALSMSKENGGNNAFIFPYRVKEKSGRKETNVIDLPIEHRDNHKILFKNKKVLMEFVHALANTVKAKDEYTQEHSELMSKVAVEIAKHLGLSESEVETVRLGAMLHDLGKIGINELILLKRGKLTNEEYEIVKQHPQIGAEIVRTVHALKDVIPLILYHHERFDGSGYLAGLKEEEIPIGARIIGIADVYQALRSDRPYRKAFSKDKAIEIIQIGSKKQFDPKIVKSFLELVKKGVI